MVGTTFIDATETTGGLTVKATSNANITLQTAQNSAYYATLAAHYSYTTPMTLSGYGGTVLAQNTGVTKTLLYANNAEQIRITATGVGIGLGGSDPATKLHLADDSDPTIRITNTDGGTNDTAAFELGVSSNTAIASTRIEARRQSDGSVDLNFRGAGTTSVAQTSAQMTLDGATGNFGIGCTPSHKLHVNGGSKFLGGGDWTNIERVTTTESYY